VEYPFSGHEQTSRLKGVTFAFDPMQYNMV
jgi:hypothetical protein